MKEKYKSYINDEHIFDKERWLGIFALIIVIGGVFGFIYEYIFYYFNGGMKAFYWRGGNFLPWINIYAIGGILIYFLTYNHRKEPLKVFAIGLLVSGLLEYISGWALDKICGGNRYWDYSNEILNFGNINGYVCFRSILFFGVSSLFFIYVIVPFCFYLARVVPKKVFVIVTLTLCAIVLFDELYNLVFSKLLDLPNAIAIYRKMGIKFRN